MYRRDLKKRIIYRRGIIQQVPILIPSIRICIARTTDGKSNRSSLTYGGVCIRANYKNIGVVDLNRTLHGIGTKVCVLSNQHHIETAIALKNMGICIRYAINDKDAIPSAGRARSRNTNISRVGVEGIGTVAEIP